MDIANWLVQLYLSEHFLQTTFTVLVFSTAVGHLFDRAMGSMSFGIVINSAAVLLAIIASMSIEQRHIVALLPDNAMRISIVAATIATGMLIMVASLRRWLRDHV